MTKTYGYLLAIIIAIVLVSTFGCAPKTSDIDKAYNIANGISIARNTLMYPIYDAIYAKHPDWKDEIESFDHDFHAAIDATLNTILAWRNGSGTKEQYDAAFQGIIDVLKNHKVEEKVPELIPTINLVKGLLGLPLTPMQSKKQPPRYEIEGEPTYAFLGDL